MRTFFLIVLGLGIGMAVILALGYRAVTKRDRAQREPVQRLDRHRAKKFETQLRALEVDREHAEFLLSLDDRITIGKPLWEALVALSQAIEATGAVAHPTDQLSSTLLHTSMALFEQRMGDERSERGI